MWASANKTYFASAQRADGAQLHEQMEAASKNAVVDALLTSVGGLLAILNEERQILMVNSLMLEGLGIPDAADLLGLRLGEAVGCPHATETDGGCGTSRYCSTCGAAIATVTALETARSVEQECYLTTVREGKTVDLVFSVRACPMPIEGQLYILLFLQDITDFQRSAVLERVFFHDLNNVMSVLLGHSELLVRKLERSGQTTSGEVKAAAHRLVDVSYRLADEVAIQQMLSRGEASELFSEHQPIPLAELCQSIDGFFHANNLCVNRTLEVDNQSHGLVLKSNRTLLLKVLTNMLTNALEATPEWGTVRLSVARGIGGVIGGENGTVCFSVWSPSPIPEAVALRLFQRNFSTKGGRGRGLGTYSMKLFGEQILGGTIAFESTPELGTTFHFTLPV